MVYVAKFLMSILFSVLFYNLYYFDEFFTISHNKVWHFHE